MEELEKIEAEVETLGKIDWGKAPVIKVKTIEEWNELIDFFEANGKRIQKGQSLSVHWRSDNSYFPVRTPSGRYVIYASYYKGEGEFVRFLYRPDGQDEITGVEAHRRLEASFRERTGKTLRVAFGVVDNEEEFEGYQYTPLIFTSRHMCNRELPHVWKADVSSAYASEISKRIPDAHTQRRVDGEVDPSEEYPFAYYPDINQLAIYGELDTRKYQEHFYAKKFNNPREWSQEAYRVYGYAYTDRFHGKPGPASYTILMREAEESLAPEYEDLYTRRKIDDLAKATMVASIGAMSSRNTRVNNKTPARHITAVVYARHLIRMINLCDRIEELGGVVISAATDSLIWMAEKDLGVSTSVKKMGTFVTELEDVHMYITGQGRYAARRKDGSVEHKHQGISDLRAEKLKITKLSDIEGLTDADQIWYDEDTGRFIL
jgi:hypothetical protein